MVGSLASYGCIRVMGQSSRRSTPRRYVRARSSRLLHGDSSQSSCYLRGQSHVRHPPHQAAKGSSEERKRTFSRIRDPGGGRVAPWPKNTPAGPAVGVRAEKCRRRDLVFSRWHGLRHGGSHLTERVTKVADAGLVRNRNGCCHGQPA